MTAYSTYSFDSPQDALAHFGRKGMKWGVRNEEETVGDSPSAKTDSTKSPSGAKSTNTTGVSKITEAEKAAHRKEIAKKVALGAGILALAAGAGYAAYSLNKSGNLPIGKLKSLVSNKTPSAVAKVLQEPTDLIHLARGKHTGMTFLKKGNTPDFFSIFDKLGMNSADKVGEFIEKAADGSGKIATRIMDPEGRHDFAGRPISHELVIPRTMSAGINTIDDVRKTIWPIIKPGFDEFYKDSLTDKLAHKELEELAVDGEEALAHFGVLGMHWGERKSETVPTYDSTVDGKAIGSPITKMDKTLHTHTQDAAYQVSALLKERYGYEVGEIRAIPPKREFKHYIAYVESDPKVAKGTIHVQRRDMEPELKKAEEKGWFGPGSGNIRATMTHETAHSMFHAEEVVTKTGFMKAETTGGNRAARAKAMKDAQAAAKADGIKPRFFAKHISGYAYSSIWVEETEAELFSQYHWNPNPPRFVKVWGESLHKEMGLDSTPFRKVVKDA